MGWKTFKEKFKVEHIVQITKKGLCIGSLYIHDLAVVNLQTGEIREKEYWEDFLKKHYPQLLEVNKEDILKIIKENDTFEKSIPVFTFYDGEILEKKAEVFGYPNLTHDGCLMYENTFFKTEKEAIEKAIMEMRYELEFYSNNIRDKKVEIKRFYQRYDTGSAKLKNLKSRLVTLNS